MSYEKTRSGLKPDICRGDSGTGAEHRYLQTTLLTTDITLSVNSCAQKTAPRWWGDMKTSIKVHDINHSHYQVSVLRFTALITATTRVSREVEDRSIFVGYGRAELSHRSGEPRSCRRRKVVGRSQEKYNPILATVHRKITEAEGYWGTTLSGPRNRQVSTMGGIGIVYGDRQWRGPGDSSWYYLYPLRAAPPTASATAIAITIAIAISLLYITSLQSPL
ncbi:hypothetical protein J6590_048212 [Homalodisca vitripennis]|nr:hypothetical protein J6590_048212 [Homalodisca vitripennis]